MSLVKIQFLEDGEWGDHPADPIFKVEAGEKKEVSASLANIAIAAGKAIPVNLAVEKAEAEAEAGPVEKAEAPKAGPQAKAEGKSKGKGKKC